LSEPVLKTHHLRAWLKLAETGSIRAAARALGLSQAAITKAIKELEEDLGAALVMRSSRGVVMTESGKALTLRARLADIQLQIARDDIQQLQGGKHGRVRVGVTPMVTMTVLATVIRRFRKSLPEADLGFFEGLLPTVLPGLRRGDIDFAVVLIDPSFLPDEFTFEPLLQLPYMVMGRRAHPLQAATDWDDLLGQEWLMNIAPGSHNQRFLAALDANGYARPRHIVESDAFGVMWNLTMRSDALIVCPCAMLETSYAPDICHIAVNVPLPTSTLGILSLSALPLSLAAARLADEFRLEVANANLCAVDTRPP
jgi:LysR family transcriptional regulator of abg operon